MAVNWKHALRPMAIAMTNTSLEPSWLAVCGILGEEAL